MSANQQKTVERFRWWECREHRRKTPCESPVSKSDAFARILTLIEDDGWMAPEIVGSLRSEVQALLLVMKEAPNSYGKARAIDYLLLRALEFERCEAARIALREGANPWADFSPRTEDPAPFFHAARNRPHLLEFLVSLGADPNGCYNSQGYTTMHYLAGEVSPHSIGELYKVGGDAGLATKDGVTPLATYLDLPFGPTFLNSDAVIALLKAGADLHAPFLCYRNGQLTGTNYDCEEALRQIPSRYTSLPKSHVAKIEMEIDSVRRKWALRKKCIADGDTASGLSLESILKKPVFNQLQPTPEFMLYLGTGCDALDPRWWESREDLKEMLRVLPPSWQDHAMTRQAHAQLEGQHLEDASALAGWRQRLGTQTPSASEPRQERYT